MQKTGPSRLAILSIILPVLAMIGWCLYWLVFGVITDSGFGKNWSTTQSESFGYAYVLGGMAVGAVLTVLVLALGLLLGGVAFVRRNGASPALPVAAIIINLLCLCPYVIVLLFMAWSSVQPPSGLEAEGYYVRGNKVYYLGPFPSDPKEIPAADPGTFKTIGKGYATDRNRAYYNGWPIENFTPANLQVYPSDGYRNYAHDQKTVLLDGLPIPEADPSTFKLVENPNHDPWSRDKNHIYLERKIFSSDVDHFEWLAHPSGLMRDSQHVYSMDGIVSDDPKNLTMIDEDYYWRDSKHVYAYTTLLPLADPQTFQSLGNLYAIDANRVYYYNEPIEGADPRTFERITNPYSKDATQVFLLNDVIPGADPATFIVLNDKFQCARDAQHAYYQQNIIPNLDPSTLPPDKIVSNCDEQGIYFAP